MLAKGKTMLELSWYPQTVNKCWSNKCKLRTLSHVMYHMKRIKKIVFLGIVAVREC